MKNDELEKGPRWEDFLEFEQILDTDYQKRLHFSFDHESRSSKNMAKNSKNKK